MFHHLCLGLGHSTCSPLEQEKTFLHGAFLPKVYNRPKALKAICSRGEMGLRLHLTDKVGMLLGITALFDPLKA